MPPADRPATEPRTEAGRALLAGDFIEADYDGCNIDVGAFLAGILAIEAEAAQGGAPLNPLTYNNFAAERHVPFDDGAAPRAEGLEVDRLLTACARIGLELAPMQGRAIAREYGGVASEAQRLATAVLENDEWDEGGGCRYCVQTPHADDCITHLAARLSRPSDERVPESEEPR